MEIPCKGPAYISGDNQFVLENKTIPDFTLKKNSHIIAYHFISEGAARDEWRTSYVNTHENEADLLTKLLTSSEKRKYFSETFYTIYFRRMQRRHLLHGVWNKTMMVHSTPKNDSQCRKIRTTICWS